ncbi:uncharacterized protein LOC125242544 [Leguminivora glycinivorella]|uniref:uncharacterized protein LOC125230459 n=1 Tax=Leguminivora glycinivorella TaxID=1035111 RepID=UPI00200CFEC4|nr:uncharacterized protein LOC125230459 [Leguminivora glycinivorella]XP_047995030.1 uncharacterized protein LOC125233183 [Leguminivora glycinivorella]XP_047996651.1 uncharacterized protein LOC125234448 [Leguminivora glycinivorella]XP_048007255.1 uncharacterized protein LOC125242544 [Leguminivora glycinivorella]
MATEAIKKLVASRAQCKASLTKLEKFIQQDSRVFTSENLQTRKASLITAFERYQDICVQLSVMSTEHAIAEDAEDETEERYYNILAAFESAITTIDGKPRVHAHASEGSWKTAHLPNLDIPTFDGRDISAYKPFVEMFEAVVHNDARLSAVQKLCFLKKYLKGEPLHLIDTLPIVGASYPAAVELLKKRYDNAALIVNGHVNTLLDLPSLHRGTALQLRDMVAKVRQHLTALQNLEQPVTSWDSLLSCILLRKLDSFTVRLYHTERDNSEQHTAKFPSFWLQTSSAELCKTERLKQALRIQCC